MTCVKQKQHRTHTCGGLSIENLGEEIILMGWLSKRRDHGNLLFIDLRDNYGITQCVISQTGENNKLINEISHLPLESVIQITGIVIARSSETVNKTLSTGEIEVLISNFHLESKTETLPFSITVPQELPEDLRLRYRFLDLRREEMHNKIMLRAKVIKKIRDLMHEKGFTEFQTPILTASSPEGARDFVVPSRLHPGKFYALPQAPQQFKQLLMISGFDKYFQIAPCFRDEDARADRSPGEFYQLDIEMSFVTQEDVFALVEDVIYNLFDSIVDTSIKSVNNFPFPRIKYNDAMLHYGCDKPDMRFEMLIQDTTEEFVNSEFSIFKNQIQLGSVVRAVPLEFTETKPRSFYDSMIEFVKANGGGGLAYITYQADGTAGGPIAKFLNSNDLTKIKSKTNLIEGAVFFLCDKPEQVTKLSHLVRVELATRCGLIDKNAFRFCWVTDFPYFEWNKDEKKIDFSHNPFSMPQGGMDALENAKTKEDLLNIMAYQYDLVCNGIELSSGAIRNHKPEIMYKAFGITGYDPQSVEELFGGMIKALSYGAPPHGGIAPGIDRIVMLLAGEPNIREIIAFPMNQQGQDLLMGAPCEIGNKHLKELNINILKK